MTLEEKIGQMCEITIDVVTDFEASKKNGFTLSEAKLDTVIGKYKVGSFAECPDGNSPEEREMGGSHPDYPGQINEGDRNTLHLRG